MKVNLVCQFPPAEGNPRNSEGAFIRSKDGSILFAYSRYYGTSNHDHATCDIALVRSTDEGKTWSEPEIIARAADFGVDNIMSVSAMTQKNGDIAFYFLIKECDFSSTIGRTVSADGVNFVSERCEADFPSAYYVVNNDRLVRLSDGRLVAPASRLTKEQNRTEYQTVGAHFVSYTTCLISDDDGKSFYAADFEFATDDPVNANVGLQEPGLMQRDDGTLYLWMRTNYGCQYESESAGDINCFSKPRPSCFTSPVSPMQMKKIDGTVYAVYNPIPNYNGRIREPGTSGRTPFVIRKSTDGGHNFGELNVIEDDVTRGYCYPALFKTKDDCMLIAYCRGDLKDGNTLCRLGINRVELSEIL